MVGWRKFVTGLVLIGAGLWAGFNGDWDTGWKLIGAGIAIVVGGNIYDHQRTKT